MNSSRRGGPEIDQLGGDVGQIGLRVDAGELAGLDERCDTGPILRALIRAGEQCVLAIERNLAVILPMSGRMLWSIIVGMLAINCFDRRRRGQ
jgi:hypothetical protein